jgi:signal peptidase I
MTGGNFMKHSKIAVISLIAATAIAFSGCSNRESNTGNEARENTEQAVSTETEGKDTPVREGEYRIMPSYVRGYSFEEAIKESDLIVDVTITEWLGESKLFHSDTPDTSTYFSAKVNRTIRVKDKKYDTIIFKQDGSSQATIYNDPIYKNGDRFLLFLNQISDEYLKAMEKNCGIDFKEDVFSISGGGPQNVFFVWQHENEEFLLSRFSAGNAGIKVKAVDIEIANAVYGKHIKSDSLITEVLLKTAKDKDYAAKNFDDFVSEYSRQNVGDFSYYNLLNSFSNYNFGNVYRYDDIINKVLEITNGVE